MSERIPQSVTKRVTFRAFLASDGKTPATGKTIAITISKNGGAFANPASGATNATAISNGFYYFDLGTGDTGTTGPLAWLGLEATINDAADIYEIVNPHNAGFDGVPAVTAGGTNGLIINGTNTGTVTLAALTVTGATTLTGAVAANGGVTFTSSTGSGFTCSSTGSNGNGISITGNGSGSGIISIGGATAGHGIYTIGTAGGSGINSSGGSGAGDGISATSGSSGGHGFHVSSISSGNSAMRIESLGGNFAGLEIAGVGTGHGVLIQSGAGATGDGIYASAISTNGNGLTLVHAGTGKDLNATTTPLTLAKTTNITGFNDISSATAQSACDAAVTANATIILINGHADVNTSTRMATYSQPTGFLAANFTTGIPVSGDFSAAMKTSGQVFCDAAITANLLIIYLNDLLESDEFVDTSVTPWHHVAMKKGTGVIHVGTELLRKQLKDTTGANITTATVVIGQKYQLPGSGT